MLSLTGETIFAALGKTFDELNAFVEDSVRLTPSRPNLLFQPRSNRDNAVQVLSEDIKKLDSVAQACHSVVQKAMRALRIIERHRSVCQLALSPIHALPNETLSQIFELAVLDGRDSSSGWVPQASVTVLARVCSSWRKVARGHQALWDDLVINHTMPSTILTQHVEYSGGRPLHIAVDGNQMVPLALDELDECGEAWLQKIESLDWNTARFIPNSMSGEASLPALKKLKLHKPRYCPLCDDADGVHTQFLEEAQFLQLQSLSIECLSIKEPVTLTAPTLTSLSLSSVTFTVDSFDAFMQGVSATLETIFLEWFFSISGDEDVQTMSFKLPHLHTMTLRHTGYSYLRHILDWQAARYPNLRTWNYTGSWTDDGIREIDDLSSLLSRFSRNTHSLTEINVVCAIRPLFDIIYGLKPWPDVNRGGPASNLDTLHMPRAPALRRLRIELASDVSQRVPHDEDDQEEILSTMLQALEVRRDRQYTPLESLEIASCGWAPWVPRLLADLVGDLKAQGCANSACRSRNAPASWS